MSTKWLSRIKAKATSIYISAENLASFSARKGMSAPGTVKGSSNYQFAYPRTVSLGLNLGF
jgi:hypothetical protein